jgi:hypothetical protein
MGFQRKSRLPIFKVIILSAVFATLFGCSDGDSASTDRDSTADASYQLTLTTSWTAATFPTNFPGGAHFTALIGGTHNNQVVFWMPGQMASAGIESTAETGSQSALSAEVDAAKTDGKAEFLLATSGNTSAAGTEELIFDINKTFPLVTLVSMVAPSPDWFVGVHDLSLVDNATGEFMQTLTVQLKVYDAGSEDGQAFSLSNANSQPKQAIALLSRINSTDHDFVDGTGPNGEFIATMTFERIK